MIDTKKPYYIAESDYEDDYSFKLLKGPNGIEFFLGEPEDCNWLRDGRDIMDKLNWYEEQLRATTPLTREELETVLKEEGWSVNIPLNDWYIVNSNLEWGDSNDTCYITDNANMQIQHAGGSFCIPLSAVTRATLRSCGVIK